MKQADRELVSALMDGDIGGVQKALSHGSDPNTRIGPVTPLLFAVMFGLAECVEPLIKAGAKVNARDSEAGRTPLHYASMGLGSAATVEALIKAGAEVNAMSDLGLTPLDLAATCSDEHIIDALKRAGGQCNDSDRRNWIEHVRDSKQRGQRFRE